MRRFLLLLAVAASVAAVHVGVAQAAACGTVTSSTTLTADCDAPLTIGASGIVVDLNGHSVVCNAAVDGIVVPAPRSSVRVRNGTVRNGTGTCVNGVNVGGNSNQFSSLRVQGPSGNAFTSPGSSNVFTFIRASGAGANGFISIGGNDNAISKSVFTGSGDDGVAFFLGTGNSVRTSIVSGTADKGIVAGASNTVVAGNTVFFNLFGIYLADFSTGSRILFNAVFLNGTGIEINATSSANLVSGNISLANTVIDMLDDNVNCDANVWTLNLFITSNPSCIS